VKAGAVAVRVVLGLAVLPPSLVLVGVVDVAVVVVVVVALVRGALVEVVPSGNGVLASTVFVPPPQPASSAASATARRAVGTVGKSRLMLRWYSLRVAHLLAPDFWQTPARGCLDFLLVTANLLRTQLALAKIGASNDR
jgi:hypothetical protein